MAIFRPIKFVRIEKLASILSHVFLWQGLFWASLLQVEGEWLSSSNIVRLAIIEAAIFPSISWLASCYDGRDSGMSKKLGRTKFLHEIDKYVLFVENQNLVLWFSQFSKTCLSLVRYSLIRKLRLLNFSHLLVKVILYLDSNLVTDLEMAAQIVQFPKNLCQWYTTIKI